MCLFLWFRCQEATRRNFWAKYLLPPARSLGAANYFAYLSGLAKSFHGNKIDTNFYSVVVGIFPLIAANLIGISLPDAKQKQKASNKSQIGAWRSKRCRRWSVRRQIDIRGLPLLFMQMRLLTCIRHKVNVWWLFKLFWSLLIIFNSRSFEYSADCFRLIKKREAN